MARTLTDEQRGTRESYHQMYIVEGLSTRQIAERTGVGNKFVRDQLARFGIERRPAHALKSVAVDQRTKETYERLYLHEHKSIRQIAKQLGTCSNTVWDDLKRFGIEARPVVKSDEENHRREMLGVHGALTAIRPLSYRDVDFSTMDDAEPFDRETAGNVVHRNLRVRFFDRIDSDIKAYALGLLWSDGSVSTEEWTVRFRLQIEDGGVLEALGQAMRAAPVDTKEPQRNHGKTSTKGLSLCSRRMVERLMQLGFCDDKSAHLPVVMEPPLEWRMSFVRGLMDGDGSLYRPDYPTIAFYNQNPYLRAIVADCWQAICGHRPRTYAPKVEEKERARVTAVGARAVAIAHALYLEHPERVAMARKRASACSFQSWRRPTGAT